MKSKGKLGVGLEGQLAETKWKDVHESGGETTSKLKGDWKNEAWRLCKIPGVSIRRTVK